MHVSQVLCFSTETRSNLGKLFDLLWFGPYPHSPYPLQISYNTLMCFDKGERHLIKKIFYQAYSLSSLTMFLKAGWFDTKVTINTWTSEKHGLTSSDHKTNGMGGRLLLRMNNWTNYLKIQYWCGSSELDSDLKVLIFDHTRICYLLKLYLQGSRVHDLQVI